MALADRLYFHDLQCARLPLSSPLSIRNGISISERQSLFISYKNERGQILYGECAPLVGVHEESIPEAAAVLSELSRGPLAEIELDWQRLVQWDKPFFGFFHGPGQPSVIFAMEQILWQALFHYFPASAYYQKLPSTWQGHLAGLIHLNSPNLQADIQRLAKQKVTVAKIKIGRQSFQDDLASIAQILQYFGRNLQLRLDANQSLGLVELEELARHFSADQVELIEEPFAAGSGDWQSYQGPLTLALDESLWSLDPGSSLKINEPLKLVLKPGRLGISGSIAWWKSRPDHAHDVILSSCYESGWSLALLLQVVAYFQLKAPLGFGTYDFLIEDVLVDRLALAAGPVSTSLQLPVINPLNLLKWPEESAGLKKDE